MNSKIRYEIFGYLIVLGGGLASLIYFDVFENVYEFSRLHEKWEVDEVLLFMPFVLVCLCVFAFFRVRELRRRTFELEMSRRQLNLTCQRLENVSRSREEFMSVACSELRLPLQCVADVLTEMERSARLTQLNVHAELARNSVEELMVLLNDVAQFVALSAGNPKLDTVFNPREVLDSIQRFSQLQANQKRLALYFRKDASVPELVQGDPGCLRLIVLNLVSNALEYTSSGRVAVECAYDDSGKRLKLVVSDTGPGIPEEKRDAIFEPYQKIYGNPVAMKKGLGLGLATVKKLLELRGGSIRVSDKVGGGSEFIVEMPVLPQS